MGLPDNIVSTWILYGKMHFVSLLNKGKSKQLKEILGVFYEFNINDLLLIFLLKKSLVNQTEIPLQLCGSGRPYQYSFGESSLQKSLIIPIYKHYPTQSHQVQGSRLYSFIKPADEVGKKT